MSDQHLPKDEPLERYEDDLPDYAGPAQINWVKTLLIVSATLVTVVFFGVGACFMSLRNGIH